MVGNGTTAVKGTIMSTPAIIWIAGSIITGLVYAAKHGQQRTYNFPEWILNSTVVVGLLYWGGFFS
jgi:hypothetical protein